MNRNTAMGLALAILLAGFPVSGSAAAPEPSDSPAVSAPEAQPAPESVDASGLLVAEAAIATGIENRAPQGAAESFPAGTEKLYCYSKFTGGKAGDEITHKWIKGGQERASVNLKVGGSPWRTFSSKSLGKDDNGSWTVEIRQGETVLKTLAFEIK